MESNWTNNLSKIDNINSRKRQAKDYQGQYNCPIFKISLKNIIPCNLHGTISIIKLLKKILLHTLEGNTKGLEILIQKLEESKIKVYKASKGCDITLEERIKKTQFFRVNSLMMLKNYDKILECLDAFMFPKKH